MAVLLLKIFVQNAVVAHVIELIPTGGGEVLLLLDQEDGRFGGGVRPE